MERRRLRGRARQASQTSKQGFGFQLAVGFVLVWVPYLARLPFCSALNVSDGAGCTPKTQGCQGEMCTGTRQHATHSNPIPPCSCKTRALGLASPFLSSEGYSATFPPLSRHPPKARTLTPSSLKACTEEPMGHYGARGRELPSQLAAYHGA